jgi:hypothetical protein
MAHVLAVDPGSGTEQCGATGPYYLDTICSSYHTVRFWGLDGQGTGALPAPAIHRVYPRVDTHLNHRKISPVRTCCGRSH